MLQIDHETLREGLDRAADLFKLHRLSTPEAAEVLAATVLANFGIDELGRIELIDSLSQMVPLKGEPMVEAVMTRSMAAGVLVGLVIANAAERADLDAIPDSPPADL
jgi:hypothetical protein